MYQVCLSHKDTEVLRVLTMSSRAFFVFIWCVQCTLVEPDTEIGLRTLPIFWDRESQNKREMWDSDVLRLPCYVSHRKGHPSPPGSGFWLRGRALSDALLREWKEAFRTKEETKRSDLEQSQKKSSELFIPGVFYHKNICSMVVTWMPTAAFSLQVLEAKLVYFIYQNKEIMGHPFYPYNLNESPGQSRTTEPATQHPQRPLSGGYTSRRRQNWRWSCAWHLWIQSPKVFDPEKAAFILQPR